MASRIRTNDLPQTVVVTVGGSDKVIILQNGKNKLIALSDLFANIKNDLVVNPDFGAINVKINGQAKENLIFTDGAGDKVGIGTGAPTELLHVAGNSKFDGIIYSSNEVLTAGESGTLTISNAVEITNIKTLNNSSPSYIFELNAPSKANQTKIVMISDTHEDKKSNLNYNITVTNCVGVSSIKLTKLGDSITFISALYNDVYKWVVQSYVGANVVA